MSKKIIDEALAELENALCRPLETNYLFSVVDEIGKMPNVSGAHIHNLQLMCEAIRDARSATTILRYFIDRALAEQATLTDADTERLVAHGEHLKDLEENR